MTKKRVIVGTIVFVFIGLLLFTFANPSQVNEGSGNTNTEEIEEKNEIKNEEKNEKVDVVEPEETSNVVNNNTTPVAPRYTNNTTNDDSQNAIRTAKIAALVSLINRDKNDYTTDSFVDYENIVKELIKNGKLDITNLTNDQIDDYINKLTEAINKLVELKLIGLNVSSNNDEYKRLDSQKELTFTAIYNDELRNKEVNAITTDLFDTSVVAELKTMNYSYSDKYGNVNVVYSYSVVKNDRDNLLEKLENAKKEINEEDYTTESVNNYNEVVNTDETDLTNEEIEELINKIEEAYEELVQLKLVGLEVSSNNDIYKRLDSQKELTFTAIYNDELRNEKVEATTEDVFNSNEVIEAATMIYSYTNKYGESSVNYNYSVVKNDRDLLLEKLEELLNKEIDEEDYTTESIENLNEAKDITPEDLTDEELEEAIEKLEEAYENLVELELVGLEVTPNNDSYVRDEEQHELTFTAIYNDELRNKEVEATTNDTFDTTTLGSKSMTYTYSDKYGKADVKYIYSVNKNERDTYLEELLNKEIDEEDYTTESIENLNEAKDVTPEDLTSEELEEAINNLEEAYENLEELELVGLEVTPNNDSYVRDEEQHKLTFTAIYNDELRNKEVEVTTEDIFTTNKLVTNAEMTYTYSDKYGEANVKYIYSVNKNERDTYLEELLNKEIDEEDYTTESIENLNEAKDVTPEDLTSEELEEAIEKIEEAYENLEELELVGLEVTPNNDTYERETTTQNNLTFTAIFNDELRNKEVEATTNDTFDTTTLGSKSMTYTYTDHGTKTVTYNYTVVKNRRDLLLDKLDELLNKNYNKDDYTTDSFNNYVEAKDITPEELSDEELEEAINNLEEAINNLVELELIGLEVTPNNDIYERETTTQNNLTFTAIFNDELRNKEVEATTNDTFDTTTLGSKSMIYSYTNHGTKTVTYNYTVVRSEDDKKIVGLDAILSTTEFGYQTEVNVKNYLTVYLVAKDGVKEETTDYTVEGFTTDELTSEKTLTVLSSEYSKELTYSVVRTEEGQQLESITVKLNKEKYNWKELGYRKTVTATDVDGTTYDVTNDAVIITDLDTNTVGEKEYKVSYTKNGITKEATTTYTVVRTNAGKVLDHITATLSDSEFKRLTTEDVKNRLTVTAFDIDGYSYELKNNEYNVSGFNVKEIGNYSMNISYKKKKITAKTTVDYTVVKNDNDLKIESVKVTLTKDNYEINEEIEGLEVEVTYGYGNKEVINTCSNDFNSNVVGYNKTLTVTCDGVKGTTNYSVYNNDLRKITASLNRSDNKYTTNSEISVTVNYTDEYNRINELSKDEYSITPELSTKNAGTYPTTVTYKEFETSFTYTVSEEFLFDLKIIDNEYIEIKESYNEFIDITKIVVTYTDNDTTSYTPNGYHSITMVSYDSKTCNGSTCVYTYPVYDTSDFERTMFGFGSLKVPTKIEVYYGKAPKSNALYHSYKLNYTVSNGKITFNGVTDLNKTYNK